MPLRSSISNGAAAGRAEVRSLAAKRGLNGGKQRTMCLIAPHPPAPTPVFRESTRHEANSPLPITHCIAAAQEPRVDARRLDAAIPRWAAEPAHGSEAQITRALPVRPRGLRDRFFAGAACPAVERAAGLLCSHRPIRRAGMQHNALDGRAARRNKDSDSDGRDVARLQARSQDHLAGAEGPVPSARLPERCIGDGDGLLPAGRRQVWRVRAAQVPHLRSDRKDRRLRGRATMAATSDDGRCERG